MKDYGLCLYILGTKLLLIQSYQRRIHRYISEMISVPLIPWGAKVSMLKITFCSEFFELLREKSADSHVE